jgi:hypothetical protein
MIKTSSVKAFQLSDGDIDFSLKQRVLLEV